MSSDGTVDRPEQRMLTMQLPGRRKRGRPEKRFMDTVKEEMQRVGCDRGGCQGLCEIEAGDLLQVPEREHTKKKQV